MQNTYTGECPHIKGQFSINVNYTYVPILGTLSRNYKKGSFNCLHIDECQNANNCPIYLHLLSSLKRYSMDTPKYFASTATA